MNHCRIDPSFDRLQTAGTLLEASGGIALVALHDFEDALVLGDRVAILEQGRVLQLGTCTDLLDRPDSARIAARLQSPPGCPLPGRIDGNEVVLPGGRLPLAEPTRITGAVEVMIPPHATRLSNEGLSGWIVTAIEETRNGTDLLLSAPIDSGRTPSASRVRRERTSTAPREAKSRCPGPSEAVRVSS